MTSLRAEQLTKRFRNREVVKSISLRIEASEVVGLLGPNGAGKTTSFYMIVGLIPSDHGSIHIDDRDVTDLAMHGRARLGMGYLAQEPSVFRKLSVEDNILAVLEVGRRLKRDQRILLCDELLERFNIAHLRGHVAMSLSGGERRRLEIARALALEPEFILLDEPFAGVDPISVMDIQQIVKDLSEKGIGILITDHNVRETLGICHRAYIINEGSVIADGTPEEILTNEEVRKVYLGENFRM